MSRILQQRPLVFAAGLALSAGAAFAQVTTPEVEPNGNKAEAQAVTMALNDRITGTCTGTATTAGNTAATSADYFRVKTEAQPAGVIYRNVLTLTPLSGTGSGHTLAIRGRSQSGGIIDPASDVAVLTSAAFNRAVAWYGFGKQEEMYVAVTGTTSTTAGYTLTYTRGTLTPIAISGTVDAGPVTLKVTNATGTQGADCWLYDSNFNPIVNNVPAGSGPGGADNDLAAVSASCSFIRTLTPGTYYLAVAGTNVANDQPSLPPDTQGNVLDFPDGIAMNTTTQSGAVTRTVTVSDGNGHTIATTAGQLTWGAQYTGNFQFARFTVVDPNVASGVLTTNPDPLAPGAAAMITVVVTPGPGHTSADITAVSADASALAATPSTVNLSSSDGGVTWTGMCTVGAATTQGFKNVPFTIMQALSSNGTGTGIVTVGPTNDLCANPVVLSDGTPSAAVNTTYAGTNDGLTSPCRAAGKGVWYTFTAPATASYRIDTCGSDFNTVLNVFQITDCADTATWTQIGCNDERPTGVCVEAQSSALVGVGMLAGQTYYIRVQGADDISIVRAGNAVATVTQTGVAGACCNHSTGACTLVASASCSTSTSTYQGDNTLCTPSPCVAIGSCCHYTTGACSLIYGGSCPLPTAPGIGTTCEPTSCPAINTCCNTSTGACTLIYGGTCPANTAVGAGTVCDPSACPVLGTCCNNTTGTCTLLYSGSCASGSSAGMGLVCDAGACPAIGTCCTNSTGVCVLIYGGSCGVGRTLGVGTVCDGSACPVVSSCCNINGVCTLIYGGTCPGGTSPGVGLVCDASTCPAIGSCCNNSTGVCTVLYGGACQSGTSAGSGVTCEPTTCPAIGICCNNSTGACTVIYGGECATGRSLGVGAVCGAAACPAVGTCCDTLTGGCRIIYGGTCPSGTATGFGTVCYASACPPVGSCCHNTTGECTLSFGTCSGSTTANPSLVCTPSPCQPAQSWACCLPDASCRLTTQDDCVAYAGAWAAGLTCGAFVCSPTNLVLNPGAETSDLSSWTITGGWSATFDGRVRSGHRSFATSNSLATRTQTVDLVASGYSADLLDSLPTIIVGDWIASRSDQGARYFVKFDLLDASQAVLDTWSHGTSAALISIAANTAFFQEAHTFTVYPAGVRYIRITEGGQDVNNWSGYYGAHFDDATAGVVILNACCLPDNSCAVQDMASCLAAGGTRQATTSCTPTPCVVITGACCAANGTCTETLESACAGTWTSGGTCLPNPCPGACCCGSHCSITTAAACLGNNTRFIGGGSACTPFSFSVPCCRGDYNKNAVGAPISVQDIFDFLTGYFGGDACSDANDSGSISVQDIFDFLTSYFGGC